VANQENYSYQPIILIGAGRSGTKIIRDVLGSHPEIDIVPFDVNYIWRIGLKQALNDAIQPSQLTDENRKRIVKQFNKMSVGSKYLLEKTVSNSLRIPYVLKVFPNAKFIHLIRDGRDVTESVLRQWGEVREMSYIFKKLKTFPIRYAFSYLFEYGLNWLKFGLFNKGDDHYIWGVKYPGYREDLESKSTLEVCAKQWKVCVETSTAQLNKLLKERVLNIKYEEIVTDPDITLSLIGQFIGLENAVFDSKKLNPKNIGKYKTAFSEEQLQLVTSTIGPTLTQHNYTL